MELPSSPLLPAHPPHGAFPLGLLRRGAGVSYVLRVLLAAGAVLAWIVTGAPIAGPMWQTAIHTPSAAGVSYDAQRASLEGETLYALLIVARQACPPRQAVLAISDDSRAAQLGNYILYPRPIDIVGNADPLAPAAIAAHTGGCVFYYGPVGGRLDPYRNQLTELTCSRDGCLYRITP